MILVTGGTGLVGSHLLFRLVNSGEKVRAVYRKGSDLKQVLHVFSYYNDRAEELYGQIEWVEAGINDIPALQKAFQGVTRVYHAAALVSFDDRDYLKMRKVNIEGTANIVNLCIDNSVEKLCFVSSIATLEKPVNGNPVDESKTWTNATGKNGYAISKQGAEMEVWRGNQEGLDVVIVNPGVIIGPGFWEKGSGKLFEKVYRGFKFFTEGVTGYVGVNDVVQIMISLMNSEIKNERFILVAENASYKRVLQSIAKELQVNPPSLNVSKQMAGLLWRADWLKTHLFFQKPGFTRASAEAAFRKTYYNSEKIQKTLDYQFKELDKTIAQTAQFFLSDHR